MKIKDLHLVQNDRDLISTLSLPIQQLCQEYGWDLLQQTVNGVSMSLHWAMEPREPGGCVCLTLRCLVIGMPPYDGQYWVAVLSEEGTPAVYFQPIQQWELKAGGVPSHPLQSGYQGVQPLNPDHQFRSGWNCCGSKLLICRCCTMKVSMSTVLSQVAVGTNWTAEIWVIFSCSCCTDICHITTDYLHQVIMPFIT